MPREPKYLTFMFSPCCECILGVVHSLKGREKGGRNYRASGRDSHGFMEWCTMLIKFGL